MGEHHALLVEHDDQRARRKITRCFDHLLQMPELCRYRDDPPGAAVGRERTRKQSDRLSAGAGDDGRLDGGCVGAHRRAEILSIAHIDRTCPWIEGADIRTLQVPYGDVIDVRRQIWPYFGHQTIILLGVGQRRGCDHAQGHQQLVEIADVVVEPAGEDASGGEAARLRKPPRRLRLRESAYDDRGEERNADREHERDQPPSQADAREPGLHPSR